MRLVAETAVFVIGTESGVHPVVVGGGIAVVSGGGAVVGRIVFEHGSEPEGCHPEVFEVVEVLADALQVTAVAQAGLRTVVLVGAHAGYLVVVGTTRCETVGHEHVEHVGVGESLAFLTAHGAWFELVVHFLLLFAEGEVERHGAWLGGRQVEIHEEVVGAIQPHDTVYAYAGIGGADIRLADVLTVDHQLERGVFHAYIPVGGFDTVYLECCIHRDGGAQQQGCQ